MSNHDNDIGMVGLGVMGRNLVLNMADHGFAVAGFDKDPAKTAALRTEAESRNIFGAENLQQFIGSLRTPRLVMLLVPAGPPVDSVIRDVIPYLKPGDVIIDGGNSYYKDTDLRAAALSQRGLALLGVGISGGEYGARYGPSIMPGGPKEAYELVRAIFEATAARADNDPCVAYLGPGSAGHYTKMVHNGIEYGLLRLIAESYALMRLGLGKMDGELSTVYERWNQGLLNSYLIEITARIFQQKDTITGKPLVDVILDEAKQKGTGKWTSEDAMELQVPVPTIDVSVAMRNLSTLKAERESASRVLSGPTTAFDGNRDMFLKQLEDALYFGFVATYAQGFALLHVASPAHEYNLNLETIARIWRGGCIIRAAMLEQICDAFRAQPDLPDLMTAPSFAKELIQKQDGIRAVVARAATLGIAVPALMTALAYYDGYRSAWMPANLIQAQRDYFGAHTYERVDAKGVFHTDWEKG